MSKVVVTGAGGLLGYRLMELLSSEEECIGWIHRRDPEAPWGRWLPMDLCNRPQLFSWLDFYAPTVLFHTAALCDPVWCEAHPAETLAVNYGGTLHLAEWAASRGALLIHVSTDLVFDGEQGDYREEDSMRPISVYGWSKLAAEEAIKASGANACIVRTSLIFGQSRNGDRGCDEKLVGLWRQGRSTSLFLDEMRTPTSALDLACKLREIAQRRITGTLHVAGAEKVSRYQLGLFFAKKFGISLELLKPIKIEDVVSNPRRARDASLDLRKAQSLLQSPFLGIEENLAREYAAPLK